MDIYAGFLIGLLGSFHCIGMCGPIAIALPAGEVKSFKSVIRKLIYNLGRIITYSIMGAVLGLLGEKIKLFGFQQILSIILGVIILISILLPVKFKGNFVFLKAYGFYEKNIKIRIVKLFNSSSSFSFLLIGILNGLLPCGLVYIALAGALALGDVLSGVLFMALFGLGTLPLMFVATLAGGFINLNIRRKISRAIPVLTLIFAVIFILRGLNLGIPLISPKMMQNQDNSTEVDCCH